MFDIRRDTERRHVSSSKLEICLTFYPEDHPGSLGKGFGDLSGFNEIRFPPGKRSAHQQINDTELITYVYKGTFAQEDSAGFLGVIHSGEFQHITTGHVIRLKVNNPSRNNWAHIFQIYLHPSEVGHDYDQVQKRFTAAQRHNILCAVASPDGRKGSLRIYRNTIIYSSILDPGQHMVYELLKGRGVWLHIVYGKAMVNGIDLNKGDGMGVMKEPSISLTVQENTEVLLIDTIPNSC